MVETESNNKTSFANSAYSQIYRFDDIWRSAFKYASSGNFLSWNYSLDGIWRELAGDLKQKYGDGKTEYKNIHNAINNINIELLKTYPLISGMMSNGFNKVSNEDRQRASKQYLILMKKEIYLRELQNELGKGTKWADEDQDSM